MPGLCLNVLGELITPACDPFSAARPCALAKTRICPAKALQRAPLQLGAVQAQRGHRTSLVPHKAKVRARPNPVLVRGSLVGFGFMRLRTVNPPAAQDCCCTRPLDLVRTLKAKCLRCLRCVAVGEDPLTGCSCIRVH